MYLAVVILVAITQVHYSFGTAKCHGWTEDRLKAVKAKVVGISIDEAEGTFLNAYVPKWLDDKTACSGLKNEKKGDHIQSQQLLVLRDGVKMPVPSPTLCKGVEKGVFEETDTSTGQVVRMKFAVYNQGGVLGCVSCYTCEEGAKKHAVENGGVTVREDLVWEDAEVDKHIKAAKAVLDELKIDAETAPKCEADLFTLVEKH